MNLTERIKILELLPYSKSDFRNWRSKANDFACRIWGISLVFDSPEHQAQNEEKEPSDNAYIFRELKRIFADSFYLMQDFDYFEDENTEYANAERYAKEVVASQVDFFNEVKLIIGNLENLVQQNVTLHEINDKLDVYEAASAKKFETLQETIEDRNRSRLERWATVPDCVRAALDAVELENNDGKAIERLHGSRETLRIKIQEELKRRPGQREKTTSKAKNATRFYPIADIAEVMAKLYPVLTAAQYIKEFEPFSCDEKNLHRAPCPKR